MHGFCKSCPGDQLIPAAQAAGRARRGSSEQREANARTTEATVAHRADARRAMTGALAGPGRQPARRTQKWYLTRKLAVFWSVVKYCESFTPYLSDQ